MIVCVCNNKSDREIKETAEKHNAKTVEELQKYMSVSNVCGGCRFIVEDLLEGKSINEFFS